MWRIATQTGGLLGREVADGAETRAGLRQVAIGQPLGDTEIDQSGPAVLVDEDVARFDVAVDITSGMGVVEGAPNLLQQLGHVVGMEGRVGGDDLLQRLPAHQLHDDEGRAVVLADVIDVDDVRVGEGGGRARLALETGAEAGIGGELRPRRLDRHVAAEEEIVTEVDDRHPPLAEAAPDAIATVDQCLRLDHPSRSSRLPPSRCGTLRQSAPRRNHSDPGSCSALRSNLIRRLSRALRRIS
ncbi:MAG: hypothetical protein K0Q71_6271 [Thermomicrobiales bacterium]|nr:hypothetical protein [Thermomicrobiales bacterium]